LKIDVVDPSLPIDLMDKDEPKPVKSRTDRAEPHLAIALRDIPEPIDK
jgi:hypothetical protein